MKTIIINASPRHNGNTAKLLHFAEEGAKAKGAEVSFYNLAELKMSGCHSCLSCKRKGAERCHCYWQDDLGPVINQIYQADALIVGSPLYFGDTTSYFHAFLERLRYCSLSYEDFSCYFKGKIDVGVICTMSASQKSYDDYYKQKLRDQVSLFQVLNGTVKLQPVHDMMVTSDFSPYSMTGMNEAEKRQLHDAQFPAALKAAYNLGETLGNK